MSAANVMSPIRTLLMEASALGDDVAVSNILGEKLLSVEEASRLDMRQGSTSFGLCALHRAKTPEVAKILIDFGIPVNVKGALEQTPLHTCCDNPAVVRLLIEKGADVHATTADGSTALEWATVADSIDTAKLLLENGATVQSANNNGNTALHLVSSRKMTELLLSYGAKVSAENNEGKIPLETAAERQGEPDFAAITELLLDVSEDRGLRFRSKKLSLQENQAAPDSFKEGTEDTNKANVRKRWSIVREKLLSSGARRDLDRKASLVDLVGRARAGTKEWHDPPMIIETGSARSEIRNGSVFNSAIDELEETTEGGADAATVDAEQEEVEHSEFYKRFFEVAIRDRPFLAKKMLDRQRTFLYAKGTAKYFLYDLSLLGGLDSVSDGLRLIVECDRRDLVAHDVVQWLVTAKWGLFTQAQVNREAILYVFFILFFILSSLKTFFPPFITTVQPVADLCLLFLSGRYLSRLLLEWFHRGRSWEVAANIVKADKFTGPVFVIELLILIGRYLLGVEYNSYTERIMETLGSVMLWVRVLYFAEAQFQSVGLTMSIVRRMIADIGVYVGVQMVFLIGFSHAMTIAFRGNKVVDDHYGDPISSFTTLLFFIFNVDQSTVIEVEDKDSRRMGMVLLAVYEALVVVIFLNLVIAVMTTSFEEVMSNARTEWLLVRAKICVRMEDQTSATMCTTRAKRHVKRLRRKKNALVMERASGENEVSLPMSLKPPPIYLSEILSGACSVFVNAFRVHVLQQQSREGYSSLERFDSLASSPHRLSKQTSDAVLDSITGNTEESFVLGTFTRHSVVQHRELQHAATVGVPQVPLTPSPEEPVNTTSVMTMSDEDLVKGLRSILVEMERRQSKNGKKSEQ